jgi:hypothetical protein
MRSRAIGAAVLLAGVLALPAVPAWAEPVGTATLEVSSPAAVPFGAVTVTGTCPGETETPEFTDSESPAAATQFPQSTVLRVTGTDIKADVTLTEGRFSQPFRVPLDLLPQEYELTTDCGGSAPFTVLQAGLLSFTPDRAQPGDSVVVTGTCAVFHVRLPSPAAIDLAGDGRWILGPLLLDPSTGVIAASTVTVPADVPPGAYTGTSNCDTTQDLEVLAPGTASDPPTDPSGGEKDLVAVPTLLGLSLERAEAALGTQLQLGDVTGTSGQVVRQDPLPGEQVPRGSEVDLELEAAVQDEDGGEAPSSFPLLPAAGGGSLLLLVLLGAPVAVHGRRVRRERRWLDQHARVDRRPPVAVPQPVDPGSAPGLDVRFEAHHRPMGTPGGGPPP